MPKLAKAALFLVVIAGVSYGAYDYGLQVGSETRSVKITDSRSLIDADFNLFWEAVDLVKQKYVDIDGVKDQDLLYGAIQGVLGSLDDPYSSFFDPAEAKKFEEDLSGSFGGIGAEIGLRGNVLTVISPLKGNPAEAAGIKAGDRILEINSTSTADMSVDRAVTLIRGKPGTEITLKVFREGWKDTKDFTFNRAIISLPTLDWEVKDGNIGYIKIHNFNPKAVALLREAADDLISKNIKGLIVDVRNNPGGYLDSAVQIAGYFMEPGEVVVKELERGKDPQALYSFGRPVFVSISTVVLVNEGSASASEILAGAMRDNRDIKLVGQKTFGKGSVQEVEELKDGSTLKITIAEWVTPKDIKIHKKGLTPDFEIKMPEEGDQDPQLDKALELLKE
jgi:carboxyl-terminal processing protease